MKRASAARSSAASGARRPRREALLRSGVALAVAVVLGVLGLLAGEWGAEPQGAVEAGRDEAYAAPALPPPPQQPQASNLTVSPVDGRGDIGFVGGISAVTPAPATSAIPDMVSDGVVLPQAALRPGGPGYRIQLGVFGDAGNALKLYEQLAAQGYDGHIQSRVLVGPFADRAAAEKARQALRQAGVGQGVLLPPEHSK